MRSKSSNEIRKIFLDFFNSKDHLIHPPSSLIPSNDPTLLLTNSGMAQFKSYFSGESEPPNERIATAQKSFRTTDIDEVGDTTHLTLFEMLGNFSFGNYFKEDACKWALELMTDHLGFEYKKIFITVHNDDKECAKIWENIGIPKEKIYFFDDRDNWWGPAGDEGPCGPCSELHYYIGDEKEEDFAELSKLKSWGPNIHEDFVELYNLVFTQFYHHIDGTRKELPNKNIDTGMGLERVATILQGKKSVYETDLFQDVIKKIEDASGYKWQQNKKIGSTNSDKAMAVLAEHSRSATFLIADGVIPENIGRGYILRRLIRKAMRYGLELNLPEDFLITLAEIITETMSDFYPELKDNLSFVKKVLENECASFSKTLKTGSKILNDFSSNRADLKKQISKIDSDNKDDKDFLQKFIETEIGQQGIISDLLQKELKLGEALKIADKTFFSSVRKNIITTSWEKEISYLEVCYLYDTLGFPYEVTLEYCSQQNLKLDKQKFDNLMSNLQKLSKTTSDFGGDKRLVNLISDMKIKKTAFKGYSKTTSKTKVHGLIDSNLESSIDKAQEGDEVYLLLNETPFYPEGGGQVGDKGLLSNKKLKLSVLDTTSEVDGYIFHKCKVTQGSVSVGDSLSAEVDIDLRNGSKRNHTGTHLLHAALREVLGKHVHQQGSLVSPDRLRFDFTHLNKMSIEEIYEVEKLMNSKIRANLPVKKHETSYSEAINNGAIAFFGDKYGKDVRTVEISNGSKFSYELCGGTHCENTGEIGSFYIISESSISSGVRRIEAVTGINAENYAKKQFDLIKTISNDLNVVADEIPSKISQLNKQIKDLKKEMNSSDNSEASKVINELAEKIEKINDVSCVIQEANNIDAKEIRNIAEQLKNKIKGVVALSSTSSNKVTIVVSIDKNLTNKLSSQKIINDLGPIIDGRGGGKPDMAQAGGSNPKGVDEAMKLVRSLIKDEFK